MDNQPARILIVDDEESILRALERALRADRHQVTAVTGGLEALAVLENQAFDLVISDQRMPGMNGTEFLSQVRRLYPKTCRVMLSGYAEFESIVGAINEAQIARFIPKPWDNTALRTTVAELLKGGAP